MVVAHVEVRCDDDEPLELRIDFHDKPLSFKWLSECHGPAQEYLSSCYPN